MLGQNNQVIPEINIQKQQTDNQVKTVPQKNIKDRVYFLSFITAPNILQDPHNCKQRFSNNLWSDKNIKSIRQMQYHVQVSINHKTEKKVQQQVGLKKQLTQQYSLGDSEYQKQLENCKNTFYLEYPLLKKIIQEKKIDMEKMFDDWVKSMKGKNFIGWFVPLRDEGPKLRKTVFSKIFLKMLDYQPQQFNYQFQKYKDLALQIVNGHAYKTCFMQYLATFRKFMSMQIKGDILASDCVKQSQHTLMNEMYGKNNKSVKVQMRFYMPNMFTVCYQIIKIIDQNQFKDHQLNQYRNTLLKKIEKTTYNSLSRITKLPKEMNPENTNKICSYQIIKQTGQSSFHKNNIKFKQTQ